MPAIVNTFWLRNGYEGLTFFGTILTPSQQEADRFNTKQGAAMKNHEMIHLRQAQACHDSWFCFYILYGWYWLLACRYWRRLKNAGYRLNPFELEAYAHMHDLHYLDNKQSGTTEWRRYAQMSLRERLTVIR